GKRRKKIRYALRRRGGFYCRRHPPFFHIFVMDDQRFLYQFARAAVEIGVADLADPRAFDLPAARLHTVIQRDDLQRSQWAHDVVRRLHGFTYPAVEGQVGIPLHHLDDLERIAYHFGQRRFYVQLERDQAGYTKNARRACALNFYRELVGAPAVNRLSCGRCSGNRLVWHGSLLNRLLGFLLSIALTASKP